jgi:hypothetical protein
MTSKRNEKIRTATEYLHSKGYTVTSKSSEPQGANDCEYMGKWYGEGTKLCIDGDCRKCERRVWISYGNACPYPNGTHC